MKAILPWLCAAVMLGAAVYLYSSNQKLTQQVAELRDQSSQAQALQDEVEKLKTTGSPAQTEKIAQLEKDNQDLLKLRNEVRQLREDKKVLGQQAQNAEAKVQAAQAQVQTAQAQAAQAAQAQAQAAIQAQFQQRTTQQQFNACINNLRQLDGAKQQWALENRKTAKDTPTEADVTPYLRGGMPKCPGGGVYTLKAVEAVPTCSIPGHQLPQ
jgi:hypothetical protein